MPASRPKSSSALLYHTGTLGDFIAAIPAIAFWKTRNPGVRLLLLGQQAVGELARESGLIDEAADIEAARFFPLFREAFSPEAELLLEEFDSAIVFADADSPLLANLRAGGIEPVCSQPPFPAGTGVHITDYHLSLFTDPESLPEPERSPRLAPSKLVAERSFAFVPADAAPIILNPGSGSRLKNWPLDRFQEVAGRLRDRGFPLVWLLGPAELGRKGEVTGSILFAPPLPLLAAILARCSLFIGNDSGVAHLAVATGCPTVVIFGPSDPLIWAPRGERVHIVCKKLDCSPCHRRRHADPGCEMRCLSSITVGDVLYAAEGLLQGQASR